MDVITGYLEATPEQIERLNGPKTISSLLAADFLGNQAYIDDWIFDWSQRNDIDINKLPLCVSESIICFKKIKRHYNRYVRAAIVANDYDWMKTHYILAYKKAWNYVCFDTIHEQLFDCMWDVKPPVFELISFVCSARRIHLWDKFVFFYGPTQCLRTALCQGWEEGIGCCLNMGADICSEDFIKDSIRLSPKIFRALSECNPPATKEAFEEFKLQKMLKRIPDVALVEEFFWIRGFK